MTRLIAIIIFCISVGPLTAHADEIACDITIDWQISCDESHIAAQESIPNSNDVSAGDHHHCLTHLGFLEDRHFPSIVARQIEQLSWQNTQLKMLNLSQFLRPPIIL